MDAARELYEKLGAPRGQLTVTWGLDPLGNRFLQVWIQSGFPVRGIPSSFRGYKVEYSTAPQTKAFRGFALGI